MSSAAIVKACWFTMLLIIASTWSGEKPDEPSPLIVDCAATLHHTQLSEAINQGNNTATSAMSGLASSGFSTDQVLGQINRIVDQQAYMLATNDIFYASAILFLLLIPLVWLAKPQKGGAGGDAAAGAH